MFQKISQLLGINKHENIAHNQLQIKLSEATIENEIDKIYVESKKVFDFIKSNIDKTATHQEIVKKSFDSSLIIHLKKMLDTHLSHLKIYDDVILSSIIKNKEEINLLQENITKLEADKKNLIDNYELSIEDKATIVFEKLTEAFKIIEKNIKEFTFQFIEDKENNNFVGHVFNLFGSNVKKDKFEFDTPKESRNFISQLESKIKQVYQSDMEVLQQGLEEQFNIASKLSAEDFNFRQTTVKTNTKKESYRKVTNGFTNWLSDDWGQETVTETVREYIVNRDDIKQQIELFMTEFEEAINLFGMQLVDEIKNRLTDDLHHNQNILQSQIDNFMAKISLTIQELDKLNEKSLLNNTYKELVDRLHQRLKTIEIILQGIKSE